ncbi:MAG: MEDS domain-containing protein, partial [Chloroflexi bacterium]|nr:MEDS domain-containing protein [Chloroflexota bacterium]
MLDLRWGIGSKTVQQLRKSGIDIIGDVPWGTHFCQFYQTKQDLLDILVPYFKTGLENNEFCMWVTAEPLGAAEAKEAMAGAIPGFQHYLEQGQIEIIPYDQWYIKGGTFESDRVLSGWVDKLNKALAKGYAGLRLTGNTFWLEKSNWQDFADYEAAVDSVIGNYRMLAICTYSLEKCGGAEIIDVLRNHEFALIKQKGRWEQIEASQVKKTKQVLHESEQRYRNLFESMDEGFALCEMIYDEAGKPIDFRYLNVNPSFATQTGLPVERVVGRTVRELIPNIESSWIETYNRVVQSGLSERIESPVAELKRFFEVYAWHAGTGQFAVVFKDVTERKHMEDRLAYLASFPELNPLLVSEVDISGNIVYLNPAIKKIFPDIEKTGSRHPYLAGIRQALQALQQSESSYITHEVKVGQRYYEQRIAKVRNGQGVRLYGYDITERK